MDLGSILIDLLLSENEAAIPGLGTFSKSYVPAEVYKFTNRISPPTQKIIFQENKEIENSNFAKLISDTKNLQISDSEKLIKEWVAAIHLALSTGQKFEITELGFLKKDGDKILFEPAKNSLLFADSFGLESTTIPLFEIEGPVTKQATPSKPIAKPTPVKPIPVKQTHTKPRNMKKWIIITGSAALLAIAIVFLYQKGMFKIFKSHSSSAQMATNDTLNGKIDANDLKRKALSYEEKQKAMKEAEAKLPDGNKVIKYYIIAGSFKNLGNAQKFQSKMKDNGYNAEILEMSDTLYRVAINSFTDRHKAVEEYIMANSKDSNTQIWLYSELASN